ncbi:MAG: hypothetical protein JO317_06825 [Verrucomicrobiae bacterium]|nr:hypothetical protein [Verrucomicrobiae bacterium]
MKVFLRLSMAGAAIAAAVLGIAADPATPAAKPAAPNSNSYAQAGDLVGWTTDCSSTKDWYDTKIDPSFQAKIEQAEKDAFKVTQDGAQNWGKVAFVIKDVDLEKTPMIQVKTTKVDQDSAFKVAVAPLDWSDLFVVIDRSSADGVHVGDIKAATGWSGKKDFNLVLIVEGKGKATWFDDIKIVSRK